MSYCHGSIGGLRNSHINYQLLHFQLDRSLMVNFNDTLDKLTQQEKGDKYIIMKDHDKSLAHWELWWLCFEHHTAVPKMTLKPTKLYMKLHEGFERRVEFG